MGVGGISNLLHHLMFVFICVTTCASESKLTKSARRVPLDNGETLMEHCHGLVYPRALCVCVCVCLWMIISWTNTLWPHLTHLRAHQPPALLELSSCHKAANPAAKHLCSSPPNPPHCGNKCPSESIKWFPVLIKLFFTRCYHTAIWTFTDL